MNKKFSFKCILLSIIISLVLIGCNFPENSGNSGSKDNQENSEPNEISQKEDIQNTDLNTAFDNILLNPDWTVENKDAINEENGVYTFDGIQATGSFKRTIKLIQNTALKFKINTNIYPQYDGVLQFLVDNNVIAVYSGLNNFWQNEIFEINEGIHTIEWKRYDPMPGGYTINNQLFVSIKDFEFKTITALSEFTQNFDSELDPDMWICNGLSAKIIEANSDWIQSGDEIIDNHGKILKLTTFEEIDDIKKWGDSSLKIYKMNVKNDYILSFDYKCDLFEVYNGEKKYAQTFKVFIDNDSVPVFECTGVHNWQNASISLSEGIHTITFKANKDPEKWCYKTCLTNSVYLDNINLIPAKITSVDIYPKGLQETYICGDPIQFSAKALRSDGSIIPGKKVMWTTNGGSIDENGLFTPSTTTGTFIVTAQIDGLTASNKTVKVHDTNYLADTVTINGHSFTGKITNGTVALSNTKNITWAAPTPEYSTFTTDGFFVLKGTLSNDKYAWVDVIKKDDDDETFNEYYYDYKYKTYYLLQPGEFEQRIWLRYGDGEYYITISEGTASYNENYDGYEGSMTYFLSDNSSSDTSEFLTVTNNTGLDWSADDCAYLMPSYYCQCDDFIVSNAFNAVMGELSQNATIGEKLRALYDWVIDLNHYDYISLEENKRKKQDAVHVVKYGMSVCEGYANLYTALARLAGVKSAYQSSSLLCHGWTECYYNGQWKMVDATWDDSTDESVTESIPNSGNYTYFLIDPKHESHACEDGTFDNVTDFSRSAISDSKTLKKEYEPDCTF